MDRAEIKELEARVQRFEVESRPPACTVLPVGPFTVMLHPDEAAIESNIATLHTPDIGAPETWVEPLRLAFVSRGRMPTVRWIEGYAPHLAATLRAGGFGEHRSETLLACTPPLLRRPAPMPGLTFVTITETTPLADVRENLDVNEAGFDPAHAQPATDEQAAQFRAMLGAARAFSARLQGHPAGAGMFLPPRAGVTELTGITTLERFRDRGIAGALTAQMASAAFAHGCDLAFLKTSNPIAQRAYERVGFHPVGTELTYVARRA